MSIKVFMLILSIIFSSAIFAKNSINIMIYNCNYLPYEFHAPNEAKETVYTQVLGSLLELKNGEIHPKILQAGYFDYKNNEYVLEMKENTYFHNNRKATLDDLEFSLLRYYYVAVNENESDDGYLGNIVGINRISELKLRNYQRGSVEGIKQEFPNKLKIKFSTPDPDFLYKLTDWNLSLVPMEELAENLIDWKKYPIGAGPYKVLEPGFKNGSMQLKKIDSSLTKSIDEVNIYTILSKDVEYDISIANIYPNFKSFYTKDPVLQIGLTFMNANELGNNINFRKFIQAAINSNELEKYSTVYKSVNLNADTKETGNNIWGTKHFKLDHNPNLVKYYFNKIPKHLRKKEWIGTVYSGNSEIPPEKAVILTEIKKVLAGYGFKIKFVTFDQQYVPKELAEKAAFDFGFYRIEPHEYLYRFARLLQSSPDIYPRPLYDPILESLYENAVKAKTRDEKFLMVNKLNDYIHEKVYWMPLLESGKGIHYNPKTVEKLSENTTDLLFLKVDEVVLVKN
ncbi:ABC transporter substrate-binding protein [Pigmentibacter ruber]|uniref:ABC transporter substrate-binding protein n=1 Tax=Pigmentibacter ruber TaxID=2683196 RepID=UPI00131B5723|nr:ABC transporter substrate-binding protein [Pigmentibacter ruber]